MSTEESSGVHKAWKSGAQLAIIGFVFAVSWGYSQAQRAGQLEAQLQAVTTEANTKLQALSKPDLPISAGFSKPFLSNDLMATFRNNSAKPLEVAAVFTSPATGQTKQITIVIPANGEKAILKGDGWEFAAGQKIELSNNDYRSITFTVPG